MMRTLNVLMFTVCLAAPASVAAGPITPGEWSAVDVLAKDGAIFWDNPSVDCANCSVGALLRNIYGPIEYLHEAGGGGATPFVFSEPVSFSVIGTLSAWKNGSFSQARDGSFAYDNGAGFVSNSLDQDWQFALFRKAGHDSTQYFIGVEDIPLTPSSLLASDEDYNDYIVSFSLDEVPEPSTLLLMGTALAGAGLRRWRRRPRQRSGAEAL